MYDCFNSRAVTDVKSSCDGKSIFSVSQGNMSVLLHLKDMHFKFMTCNVENLLNILYCFHTNRKLMVPYMHFR